MAESRKHHFVPQLYQRGFARRSGKAWKVLVLDRATGQARGPVSVREVFAERNYNTVVDADGNRNLIVEHLLAEHVEDGAAYGPCFARFQRGERLPASLSYTLLLPV